MNWGDDPEIKRQAERAADKDFDLMFNLVAEELARQAESRRTLLQEKLVRAIREVDRVEDGIAINKLLRDVLGPTTHEVEGD